MIHARWRRTAAQLLTAGTLVAALTGCTALPGLSGSADPAVGGATGEGADSEPAAGVDESLVPQLSSGPVSGPCPFVDEARVVETFDLTEVELRVEDEDEAYQECLFKGRYGGQLATVQVAVTRGDVGGFEAVGRGEGNVEVSGLGEEAYIDGVTTTLRIRKGEDYAAITAAVAGAPAALEQHRANLKGLGTVVAANF